MEVDKEDAYSVFVVLAKESLNCGPMSKRGVRQGDFLLLFLFIIVVDVLNCYMVQGLKGFDERTMC